MSEPRVRWRRLRSALACLAVALLLLPGAALASSCLPIAGLQGLVRPAAWRLAEVPAAHLRLTFIGHASFLIETPDGVRAVTDYNGVHRPAAPPDLVTMNHAHSTHYTDLVPPEVQFVLRGWRSDGTAARHDVRFKDLRVRNVTTNIRSYEGGTEPDGNSIFIFEAADLCVAHLGHLHHLLTPGHLAELGQVDVLLAPVDGGYTLDLPGMVEVIEQIRPSLVIPMHFFSPMTLQRFLDGLAGRYPVRFAEAPVVTVSRAALPRGTEVLVLPGH